MLTYLIKRVLFLIPTLLGITLVTFILFHVVGGNPAALLAGKYATPERIAQIEKELGLDQSIPMQYFNYVKQSVTFDFGRSWSSKQQISTIISEGLGPSLSLTVPAFIVVILLSIVVAMMLAYKRGGILDRTVMILCLAGISVSSLVYILYMQYGLAYYFELFPISGWDPDMVGRWSYLTLPMLIFIAISVGGNVLFYRSVFLDEMHQDYVRTARAKGLSPHLVLFKHVLRNAMIPIITLVVLEMPFLILGSLLLESFFGIPGLGGVIYSAIQNADFPLIKAMTFVGALLYMVFQLLSDILYKVADPRIQLR